MIPLHSDTAGRARIRTTVGVPVGRLHARRLVRRQLEHGPFLAAFDAVGDVRDIAGPDDYAHLVRDEVP